MSAHEHKGGSSPPNCYQAFERGLSDGTELANKDLAAALADGEPGE